VLGLLAALGWSPGGESEQSTATAAPMLRHDERLIQQWQNTSEQRWSGILTPTRKYVRYENGDEALYDLVADPHERHNLANTATFAAERNDFATRLDALLSR
jgi:hypothetical protein